MIIMEVRCNCCDKVGERGDPRKRPAHVMRADLRRKGWVQKGRIDFCPDCKPKSGATRPG